MIRDIRERIPTGQLYSADGSAPRLPDIDVDMCSGGEVGKYVE